MEPYEQQPSSPKSSGWTAGLFQLVFVIAVIAAALGLSRALKGQVSDRAPQIADLRGDAAISIRIADLEIADYAPEIRVNGTVQAAAEVAVSPQVSGEVVFVSNSFRAGAEVKKGDRLFEIDRADFVLAIERAESEIAAAQSDLQQLEAEAAIAIQEWQELYPGREVNELAARVPQIEAAKARLSSAVANKRSAELSLKRTRVIAPYDARILASSLDAGQIVSPGQSVGRLIAVDSIEIAVPVSSDQLTALQPVIGRMAAYSLRGADGRSLSAQTVRVDASLDVRTRLSNLYLKPEDASELRIGDFVDVAMSVDLVADAIKLPASALSGQSEIWVVENNQLEGRTILVLGEEQATGIVVAAPFDIAEGVVALPPLEAEAGQNVTVRTAPAISVATGGQGDAAQ
ncbi:MAG: efflux RND transporter periplasmic adaptor subunit [Henriciella sp.]|nr:efflux RND transporter periplasmic adaptor subunit [Henriciella sp.]